MKNFSLILLAIAMSACQSNPNQELNKDNPFLHPLNEAIAYDQVTHEHLRDYAQHTLDEVDGILEQIRKESQPDFENTFVPFDKAMNSLSKASNNCFMFYWVSPDSLSRDEGLKGYQVLDSLYNALSSDASLFTQMQAVRSGKEYASLEGHRKRLVDDVILQFEHSGVGLDGEELERFRRLKAEISELTSSYSINMNTANALLKINKEEAKGIPEGLLEGSLQEDGSYAIPAIPANRGPVLDNADMEQTRKDFLVLYMNRGYEKNLDILEQLVRKRHELAGLMDYPSYAAYTTELKMSGSPDKVWTFLEDLINRSHAKAEADMAQLKEFRNKKCACNNQEEVQPWDVRYYKNQLLIEEFQVDHEEIREYLPMDQAIEGMLGIFEETLGLEYRKVENAPVWHEEVLLYEVLKDGQLTGRFYLDLYPRPNKESWFYGVQLNYGRLSEEGQEIPSCLLLANFTPATDSRPAMVTHGELRTLFHEFGHIMDNMAYAGEFALQAGSKDDFVESMSQIFENWIWDYDMLSRFAKHYESGEVLPRSTFDKMVAAKNVGSGISALGSARSSVYDMLLYDRFDPEKPFDSDALWLATDRIVGMPSHVEGTHPQGSWIHINTHPTYYYGYLWAEVYAQDMFTVFEEQGLTNPEVGQRYYKLILANGTQRDANEAVEEFLGRPMNNEAYIRSLGL